MLTEVPVKPSFELPEMSPEALGELFIETAQRIVAASGANQNATATVNIAIRTAAQFVEAVHELQRNQ